MKRFVYFIFLLLLFFVSCKKDDSANSNDSQGDTTINHKGSCKINNVLWETDSTESVFLFDTVNNYRQLICNIFDSTHVLTISWTEMGSNTMTVPSNVLNLPADANVYFEQSVNGISHDNYNSTSGQLQFTSYDSVTRKVSGNFNAQLVEQNFGDTVNLSNGKFNSLKFTVDYIQ